VRRAKSAADRGGIATECIEKMEIEIEKTENTQREESALDDGLLEKHSAVLNDGVAPSVERNEESQEIWEERESRNALRHIAGLSTELQDVNQVEYRKVRLERVVLVGTWSAAETTQADAEESMRELAALADTAGAEVLDALLQHRFKPDPASYIGSGKAKEVARIVASEEADTVIVNADLPPSQRRTLEDIVGVKVVDRTAVILDIFAQHATSREGKAQVELAQLEYMLPRLRGWGTTLSRQAGGQAAGQAGGIGSRGPGETKIEMDRRRIRRRISKLKADIAKMKPAREVKRGSRHRQGMPLVAVIGYTNAGKSSLTNRLTRSSELVENALFATLDTAVRRTSTRSGRVYAYADTVGFVRDLPTQLVEAFKSTLEEIADADLILHVVDASYANPQDQIDAVNSVTQGIEGVEDLRTVVVFNKVDRLDPVASARLRNLYPGAQFVSAATGEGIDDLRALVEKDLPVPQVEVEAVIGYGDGGLVEQIRQHGVIERLDYTDSGISLSARVDDALAARILRKSH
jgi:GTP-binding protein HflX